jgi:hypothetical protein
MYLLFIKPINSLKRERERMQSENYSDLKKEKENKELTPRGGCISSRREKWREVCFFK